MMTGHNKLRLIRAGVDTYQQPIVYMRSDCHVCRSEGFAALTRVRISTNSRSIVATLNVVHRTDILNLNAAALSEAAWTALAPSDGELAMFSHPEPPRSASALRAKVFGKRLEEKDFLGLMRDAMASNLSDLELAAFVTTCAGDRLNEAETIALTRAMLAVGEQIDWGTGPILDKHCVGGLPGNRTTPIVVAIIAAAGHLIPKTSSRAITSPAGTADTMAVMTSVSLDLAAMRRVVEREGGCIVWGGRVRLSPADDVLIRIERPLDFDSDGQLVASVLSKKAAAGSTHVLIDVPVGSTAKIRTPAAAEALGKRLGATAKALGFKLAVLRSDGRQPVGFGIGPSLEAQDVLAVLRGDPTAPRDLRDRALDIAGRLLELTPGSPSGTATDSARDILERGGALTKFMAICQAQGGFREPGTAAQTRPFAALRSGRIEAVDNRLLAKVAKLAGAPAVATAGLIFRHRIGDEIETGDTLFEVHADTPGALQYALDFAASHPNIIQISEAT